MSINNCRRADEILGNIFNGSINSEDLKLANDLNTGWASIVGSISSNKNEGNKLGQFLVAHTRIIDLTSGVLLIETDHPGYIQIIQMYNAYIMKGLKMKYPQIEVKAISCRLKNTDVHVHELEHEQKENEGKACDNSFQLTESEEAQFDKNIENMPQDLREALENLKNSCKKTNKKK